MAEFSPNKSQERAIKEDGKNILVSAGAGSGKTTVLVERVIEKIVNEGADIESFIIITFTRAAAANMKEKIFNRIKKRAPHLKDQLMKVYRARICTIDSLCTQIVRENFQYADIDPGFRIADESEINIMKHEVLSDVIEEQYKKADPDFINLVNYYIDRSDAKLEEIILKMYDFSRSHPEPDLWLDRAKGAYESAGRLGRTDDEGENAWMADLAGTVEPVVRSLCAMCEQALRICDASFGPYPYRKIIEDLSREIAGLEGNLFDNKYSIIDSVLKDWKRLPSIRAKNDDIGEDEKEAVKKIYNNIKKQLGLLRTTFFSQMLEPALLDMGSCAPVASCIVDMVRKFADALRSRMRAANIAGFSDINHMALDILVEKDEDGRIIYDGNGNISGTEAADRIAKNTTEIIVDEYQDTNRLQDAIVEVLSSQRFGRGNIFMVGDVKQSIYAFRMACPELFIEKYKAYKEGPSERMILGENYRSRQEVICFINRIFDRIMIEDLGGIDYKDGGRMTMGANFPMPEGISYKPEMIFVNAAGEFGKKAEALVIAKKIEEITENLYIKDEDGADEGAVRKAGYSDIAILTRTSNNKILEKTLDQRHIPVKKASNKGFFSTVEIRLVLDLLKVIDNPYQDIPLASVILSPITGADARTLAEIRISSKKGANLYDALIGYVKELPEDTPLRIFTQRLEKWRREAALTGIVRFIEKVIDESGAGIIFTAMKEGKSRLANIGFLKKLAADHSATGGSGLFSFLRYIEELQKADVDYGTASSVDEVLNAVTMMTIHGSKGLEFPVVILADTGRRIDDKDSSSPVVMDEDAGLGIECRDINARIKKKSLIMETIIAKRKRKNFAEEIRLLYVAMSRAREKLIITGSARNILSKNEEWEKEHLAMIGDVMQIMEANSYMLLCTKALLSYGSEAPDIAKLTVKDEVEIELERAAEIFEEAEKQKEIQRLIGNADKDMTAPEGIYSMDYPYLKHTKTAAKITASQMEADNIERAEPFVFRGGGGITGAQRGNAYHKVFELLDYSAFDDEADNEKEADIQIERMCEKGYLSSEQAKSVAPEKIAIFISSDLGRRMKRAYETGNLNREKQFVMGTEIDGISNGLVQGIVDAFFFEEDEDGKYIVLADYKTDVNVDEKYLLEKYGPQQKIYANALESAYKIPVREMILYSTHLEKQITLK